MFAVAKMRATRRAACYTYCDRLMEMCVRHSALDVIGVAATSSGRHGSVKMGDVTRHTCQKNYDGPRVSFAQTISVVIGRRKTVEEAASGLSPNGPLQFYYERYQKRF